MTDAEIRIGIIGVQPDRSWAALAHIPALQAMPGYRITAVATTRRASAEIAAARYAIPHAFDDFRALVRSPDVDVVVVTVKVPDHFELVAAAIAAGKHVYCEWPLGNGLAEAETLAGLATRAGVRTVIGLQARFSPTVAYARDLIGQGYVGEVLSTSVAGTGLSWGDHIDAPNAYTLDIANGATMLTIPVAHALDALCHVLGDVREVQALLANRRKTTILAETGAVLPMTAPDQVAVVGLLANEIVFSLHYRGGMAKDVGFLWEINGTKGDLRLTSPFGHAQIFPLALTGATEGEDGLHPLDIPESYFRTAVREGPALNVAQVYAEFAHDVQAGTYACPGFDHAVQRHRLVDAIERAARTGERQRV